MNHEFILAVASHFALGSTPVRVKELTAGNINVTYRLDMAEDKTAPRYVLQRINTAAFKDPVSLMENIGLVTAHIRQSYEAEGMNPARRVLTFVEADNGTLLYEDAEGGAWRCYVYVDDVTAYDAIESAALFREAGVGFGEFQTRLADFPAEKLAETIPGFHNTARRFETFMASVEKDAAGRAASVADEIEFFASRKELMSSIVDRLGGELPLRVTHNDTKLNNVMLDEVTHEGVCVIDLDTVMPGSMLYDFGDALRFGASTGAEDETDLSKIEFDLTYFEAFTKAFLEEVGGDITPRERELLSFSALLLTLECGIRFLTDYLNGDTYFRIHREHHNLDRCRTQFKLVADMEKKLDQMDAIVAKY